MASTFPSHLTNTGGAFPLPLEISRIDHGLAQRRAAHVEPGGDAARSEIVDVNHGTCTKIRIALDMDEAGKAAGIPDAVILKGGFEPHSRMMHYMHGEEVHAYADVRPHTPLRLPACWFAAYDGEAQQGIVIMDDLVARGVEFLHPQRPQAPEQVAKRLTRLAQHHAMTWDSPDIRPGGSSTGPAMSPMRPISRPCSSPTSGRAMSTAPAARRLRSASTISTG